MIEIENVSVEYRSHDGARFLALKRIDLEIRAREFVCLVGPSGCGKSTLLNAVAGFEKPSSGRVLIDGSEVSGPDSRRIFVFQDSAVFPWMTVQQNLAFASRSLGRDRSEEREHLASYMEMVGLKGFEGAYPHQLSGGMRQRAEIARALAADPDVIFMDEPFSALDYFTKLRLRRDLLRIWEERRMTVLFVTHDVEEAVQLADRVVVMGNSPGRILDVVDIGLPRPRDIDAAQYLATRDRLLRLLGLQE